MLGTLTDFDARVRSRIDSRNRDGGRRGPTSTSCNGYLGARDVKLYCVLFRIIVGAARRRHTCAPPAVLAACRAIYSTRSRYSPVGVAEGIVKVIDARSIILMSFRCVNLSKMALTVARECNGGTTIGNSRNFVNLEPVTRPIIIRGAIWGFGHVHIDHAMMVNGLVQSKANGGSRSDRCSFAGRCTNIAAFSKGSVTAEQRTR